MSQVTHPSITALQIYGTHAPAASKLTAAPDILCPISCAPSRALGCTLYAGMYGMSPFEYCLGQSGGSIALSILNGQVRWPTNTTQFFPPELHELVLWMLKHSPHERPTASSVATRVAELLAQHPWVVTVDIPPPVTGPAAEAGEKILAAADDAPPGA